MTDRNPSAGDGHLPHGTASPLFPVNDLASPVHHGREAELALTNTEDTTILTVTPTGMASSYFLTQHVLTAIPIATLDPPICSKLDEAIGPPLNSYTLIQIGSRPPASPDHALTEYTDTDVPEPRP